MHGLYPLRLQDVGGEEGGDEEDDEDQEGPGGEDLLLARFGRLRVAVLALALGEVVGGGVEEIGAGHGGCGGRWCYRMLCAGVRGSGRCCLDSWTGWAAFHNSTA